MCFLSMMLLTVFFHKYCFSSLCLSQKREALLIIPGIVAKIITVLTASAFSDGECEDEYALFAHLRVVCYRRLI